LQQQIWSGNKIIQSLEHAPSEILNQCEEFAEEQKAKLEAEA